MVYIHKVLFIAEMIEKEEKLRSSTRKNIIKLFFLLHLVPLSAFSSRREREMKEIIILFV